MTFIARLFASPGYFDLPAGVVGWLVWLLLLGMNIYLFFQLRKFQRPPSRLRWIIFLVLLVLTPMTTLFLGVHLPATETLPVPGKTLLPTGAALMFLSAVPWCLAAGFLGPGMTGLLAGLSGAFLAYYDSHNIFVPLIYFFVGLMFSWLIRQQYRTLPYRLLRIPVLAGFVVALGYPLLLIAGTIFSTGGLLVVRINYAISQSPVNIGAFSGQLLMGVAIVQVLAVIFPQYWVGARNEEPSPTEASLEANLVYRMMPLMGVVAVLVLLVSGVMLGQANRRSLIVQMEGIAASSASFIPFSLETGQNLIVQLAEDPRLIETDDPDILRHVLIEYLNRVPFFNQLTYLDNDRNLIAGYPLQNPDYLFITPGEQRAIDYALSGVRFQSYSLPSEAGKDAARLVFVVSVQGSQGYQGVVLGQTNLDQNPFFIPVMDNLAAITSLGGAGALIDEQGMVLYHPDSSLIGTIYPLEVKPIEPEFDPKHTSSDGKSEMLYAYPVPGRSWTIITTIPASVPQQAALEITITMLGLLIILLLVLYGGLKISIHDVIQEIGKLAKDAWQIASGELNMALETDHIDEVGQLAQAVNGMRLSLKARMEEADQLLAVTTGVASSMDLESAVVPILEGALSIGASSARLVLTAIASPEFGVDIRTRYGEGTSTRTYKNLDTQILALTTQRPEVLLSNPARARLQNLGDPLPQAVLAYALEHEGIQYGALWLAFDEPHPFSDDERRFVRAVASQAALAASNARLYLSAQLGRQRMEEILASTPEPVIVTDFNDRFLLVNPAGQVLLGRSVEDLVGKSVAETVDNPALQEILIGNLPRSETGQPEVTLGDGRVYFVTASPVRMDDSRSIGRVCLLRDVTHYKELDEMKSEFVENVSHDLRAPLGTIQGYANMLDMVGDLNEQQARYARKISESVERMYRFVTTLLDIGRIEAGIGLKLEWLSLADVIQQVAESLRVHALQKQINYQVVLPDASMPMVQADRARIEQAIKNVIDNAIKFTDNGGEVMVSLRVEAAEAEYAVIEVKDTGAGISPLDQPRLFERFYRGAERKIKTDTGTGLGLSIVKSIIEQHHGHVDLESRLGEGSTFSLTIPLRQPEE